MNEHTDILALRILEAITRAGGSIRRDTVALIHRLHERHPNERRPTVSEVENTLKVLMREGRIRTDTTMSSVSIKMVQNGKTEK